MAGTSLSAPHPTIANLWVVISDSVNSNHILFGYCNGTPGTTADTYAHGCILNQRDSGTGTKAIWQNTGSTTSPSWARVDSAIGGTNYNALSVNSNGTATVNVFGAAGAPTNLTITSVGVVTLDTTAATYTVSQAGVGGIFQVAKSATLGLPVYATQTGVGVTAGTAVTLASSTTGNAIGLFVFTTV